MNNKTKSLISNHILCLTVLLTYFASTSSLVAKDYFMSPIGDDEAEGTLESPWASAAKFADLAEPGDTLFIRGGVYRSQETILRRSGLDGKPITFRNYQGEVPIFDGTDTHHNAMARFPNAFYSEHTNYIRYISIEGLVIRNYFRGGIHLGSNYVAKSHAQTNDHLTIRHCLVDNCGQNGITVSYGDWATVESCLVSRTGWNPAAGSWSSNINLYNMVGVNNRVSGNVSFHSVDISSLHTDGNGMILDMFEGPPGAGATVENNLLFENGGVGIAWTRCQNAHINNNTLWENAREPTFIHPGCGIYFWDANTNINMRNTIVWQSGNGDAMQMNGPFVSGTRTNNLITRQPGATDPGLADPSKLDFHPGANSPAREAGTSTDTPTDALWFDSSIIKSQTTGQPISWYRWAPDYERLISNGGLAGCLRLVKRPDGKMDIGAMARTDALSPPTATATGTQFSATNLLVNGGFEVLPKQWDLAKNTHTTEAEHFRGGRSLQIDGSTSWSSTWQSIPTLPNTKYLLRAWMKGHCPVNMKVATSNWTTLSDNVQTPTDTWTQYEVRFESGANTEVLIALMDGGNGVTYVDTISVTKE